MEYQTVWRGVSEDLSAHYPRGKEFTWWGLSSCTTAISVLESPLYIGTSGPRTMFSIETKAGKSIRTVSYFQNEDEILLPPGRYLKVIDKSSPAPDLHIVHLREIQPPHPMLAKPFDLSELKQTLPSLEIAASPPLIQKQQENNPAETTVVPKAISTSSIMEKKVENSTTETNAMSKVTSTAPVMEKKEGNNPTAINTMPKSTTTLSNIEKTQENDSQAKNISKPALKIAAQEGEFILSFSLNETVVMNCSYFKWKLTYFIHAKMRFLEYLILV